MIFMNLWLFAIIFCKYLVHGDHSSSDNDDENGKLIFVHVLFRHGDGTPIDPYPNYPWGNKTFWPVAWGQLTNLGKQQHYNLGKWLRSRYDNLYNNLFIEDLYNMSLPEWTKKVYPGGDMQWLAARSFATNTYTTKLARLKVGFLIKEIFERFSNKSLSLSNPKQSVWIYSAHDTTVANLLNALGLFELHTPPYTACVLLELRLKNHVPMVQIFYKNTTSDSHPMHLPNCGIACPLEKLYRIYDAIIPGQFEDECRLSILTMTYEDAEINVSMGLLISGCIILLLVVSVIAILTFSRRQSYPTFEMVHSYRQLTITRFRRLHYLGWITKLEERSKFIRLLGESKQLTNKEKRRWINVCNCNTRLLSTLHINGFALIDFFPFLVVVCFLIIFFRFIFFFFF